MKKLRLLVLFIFMSTILLSYAQEGIKFHELSIEEAIARATDENKPIFVHITASWSGPCKYLKKSIFTNGDLANYYNAKFINVRIDLESVEGSMFSQKHTVEGVPALYYLDLKGEDLGAFFGAKKADFYLSVGRNIYGEKIDQETDVHPGLSLPFLVELSAMDRLEWEETMMDLQLEKREKPQQGNDCFYYKSSLVNNFSYGIEKCGNNYIEFDFGAFNNGDDTIEKEVNAKIELFVKSLEEYYVGEKTLGGMELDEYEFNHNGTRYSVILLDDDYCAGAKSCERLKVYFRWS